MQREITRIALASADGAGFALAGSGAIREHGLIRRPTDDIDLFTIMSAHDRFGGAVDAIFKELEEAGWTVELPRRSDSFARMSVSDGGQEVDIDLGIDWRSREPVTFEIGPVLAIEDAVGNKVAALYSRGEARDYLDVDEIRSSGRFTDGQLIDLGINTDPGFDIEMFARRLTGASNIQLREVAIYGVSQENLDAIARRSRQWARELGSGQASTNGGEDGRAE